MSRAKLNVISSDVISDSGAVLWSFVKGEALEFPIYLDFLATNQAVANYTFEAVVVEANNVADQDDKPDSIRVGGVQTVLTCRKPASLGNWNAATAYNYEDVVLNTSDSKYYRLLNGVNRVSATNPTVDPFWEETTLNRVYVQFPMTLASTWSVQPSVLGNAYGFFELRVTEPNNSIFVRTWKPVRGMVEILFSPTDVVA
jgi:hypothetical protein